MPKRHHSSGLGILRTSPRRLISGHTGETTIAAIEEAPVITLYACNFHGAFAHGVVRDIRVRWALEEAGLRYETRVLGREEAAAPAYRDIHPFAKFPALVDDDVVMFESAAIVLYLGEKSEVLLPRDKIGKARTTAWVCAAATTVEGIVDVINRIDHFPINREADHAIRPRTEQVLRMRLDRVSEALENKEYLESRFTGADIMMRSVLDMLRHTNIVAQFPVLSAYMARCAARPAFQRAMEDHLSAYQPGPA
jgi:glutathione S-transferase